MYPGINLSMQHIPNVDHQMVDVSQTIHEPSIHVNDQQPPPHGLPESNRKSVQEVFVVDLRKINGSFGIRLTVSILDYVYYKSNILAF